MLMATINVGDRVQINANYVDDSYIGKQGEVIRIDDPYVPWPVGVKLDSDAVVDAERLSLFQFDASELDVLSDDDYHAEPPC
jgi:hypothetical protein